MADEALGRRLGLELLDQARLADPRIAADHYCLAGAARATGAKGVPELNELGAPADERPILARGLAEAEQTPGSDRLGQALDLEGARLLAGEAGRQHVPHRVRDEDDAGCRGIGQTRGEVHRVTGDAVSAVAGTAAGDDLAAGDADVHVQVMADLA